MRDLSCGDTRIFLELEVRRLDCRNCGRVKRERLDFLADNPHYTKRFAYYVGRRCRSATIKDVAADLRLDWHTVKTLDQQYMQAQLARAGRPGPQVIGIDEIAIPISGALHNAPVMDGDCRINEIAPQGPQPRQRALLVGASEATESDYVSNEDSGKLSRFGHGRRPRLRGRKAYGESD